MKKVLAICVALLAPSLASADNIGGCGWGAKLMDGNQGVAPQVLAVTTNGTFGNQTFGISSGTSGCTQDGVVNSNWKLAAFVDENRPKLARDIAVGSGEQLDALATLLGVEAGDRNAFRAVTHENFGKLFPSEDVNTNELLASLKEVLASDSSLAGYSAQL